MLPKLPPGRWPTPVGAVGGAREAERLLKVLSKKHVKSGR